MIKISENIKRLIEKAKEKSNIALYQLEKDYLLTMILRELVKIDNNIIFKGGTCLSKAYKVIERFSEDIDITYLASYSKERKEYGVSGKQRYEINSLVEKVLKKYDFKIENDIKDTNKKKMDYVNKRREFIIKYDNTFGKMDTIKIDSSYITPTKEFEEKEIRPLICEILGIDIEKGEDEEAISLTKFKIKVEKEEQIISDKFFALCKHLKIENYENYSRHIYDIHKVMSLSKINIDEVKEYVKEIEKYENENALNDKKNGKRVEENEMKDLMLEVCRSDGYKNDFINNLQKELLFESEKGKIDFTTCIKSLEALINKNIFLGIRYYFVLKKKTNLYKFDKELKIAKRYPLQELIGKEFKGNKVKAFEQWNKWKEELESENKENSDNSIYKIIRFDGNIYVIGKGINEKIATQIIMENNK